MSSNFQAFMLWTLLEMYDDDQFFEKHKWEEEGQEEVKKSDEQIGEDETKDNKKIDLSYFTIEDNPAE